MKVYMIETIGDYLCQLGCSLNKEIAEKEAARLDKRDWYHHYWVTEYEVDDKHYTDFE